MQFVIKMFLKSSDDMIILEVVYFDDMCGEISLYL